MGDQPQGTAAPGAAQGDDAPKFVTEEQLNRAITARLADFGKKSEKALAEAFTGFEKKLGEIVAPKTPEGATPPGDAKSILDHPEVKGMAKKLGELEQRAKAAEDRALAEEQRGRDSTLRTKVAESLTAAGIKDATRAKHAMRFLVDGEKLVRWNDDHTALVFADGDAGDVDFATGLKGWLKSDDAKLYLPAPDARTPEVKTTRGNGAPPAPLNADSSFEDKLAATASQLSRSGVPVT